MWYQNLPMFLRRDHGCIQGKVPLGMGQGGPWLHLEETRDPLRAHPCARARGCSVARKVEDQKMEISVCCLCGPLTFSVNKNACNCQASLTALALQSLQCAFLSVFFLQDANFTSYSILERRKKKIFFLPFWHFCCMWIFFKEMLLWV